MKIANNLNRKFLFLLVLVGFSNLCFAFDHYKEFKRDQLSFDVDTQYFYSKANYTSFGLGSQNLAGNNYYQLIDTRLSVRYVPRPNWSVFASGTVSNSESRDTFARRTNSSLSEASVGADFLMYSGAFDLVPEFLAVIPLEKPNLLTDTVFNAEGVNQVQSRLSIQKSLGILRGYGWLGFTYRGDGRSYLMPWGVGIQIPNEKTQWGAELFGYQSISEDSDKASPLRAAYINGPNAGSYKFYSVNPSLVDSRVYGTWIISPKWSLQADGGMTIAGSTSAAGFHVGGMIRYNFDLSQGYYREKVSESRDSKISVPLSSEKKVKDFQESIDDDIDQNLFKVQPATKTQVDSKVKELDFKFQDSGGADFEVELKSQNKTKKKK